MKKYLSALLSLMTFLSSYATQSQDISIDFKNKADLKKWSIDLNEVNKSKIDIKDGALILDVNDAATIWLKQKLGDSYMIEFDRTVLVSSGKNDRLGDFNIFWQANDLTSPSPLTNRNPTFANYDALSLYYIGVGGHNNTTTRFRKYDGTGDKPILKEYTDSEHLLKPNQKYHVKILYHKGLMKVYVDDLEYINYQDEKAKESGYFAFRMFKSRHKIENFKVLDYQNGGNPLSKLSPSATSAKAQPSSDHPRIWVKPSDKKAILDKIETQEWANDYYKALKEGVQAKVDLHTKSPEQNLFELPLDWNKTEGEKIPKIISILDFGPSNKGRSKLLNHILDAVDCGVLYYLTEEEKYAQYASDVLYTIIEGMKDVNPNFENKMNGGYIYPNDHLREAREVGAQLPVIYDFIRPFLDKGGLVYNPVTKKRDKFSILNAEKVFTNYINLALNVGIINCNWPVLESSSLVCNTLALDNEDLREKYLNYYLTENTPNQDALKKVAEHFLDNGGKWPESTNYADGVTSLSTYLMTLLTRYDKNLHLGIKYNHVPFALNTSYYLTYPNHHDKVLFGDGHRTYHPEYEAYEIAYSLGVLEGDEKLKTEFGALIKSGILDKSYDRSKLPAKRYGAEVYQDPIRLLWFEPEVEGQSKEYPLPVVDNLPFAGMTIQRNISSTQAPKDGLMAVMAGGSHVHSHASGLSAEFFGKGHVLGSKSGRGTYTTEIHENYYRIFAGHNTVVVNGASQSDGGWANLGTNTVKYENSEPKVQESPVSANYSFASSSFIDDKGDGAEAVQNRTIGIIRTSPTSGYYVDVFKSKSSLPNQYHDYIYHNIGEKVVLSSKGKELQTKPDDKRYQASAAKEWVNNKKARHPGWHYFKEVKSSPLTSENILTTFTTQKLGTEPITMKLFIPGQVGRTYTSSMAPPSNQSYKEYEKLPTPTVVIRQEGEAWDRPFAVVYQAQEGKESMPIQSVSSIIMKGKFKGFIVVSGLGSEQITQSVLTQENEDDVYLDQKLKINFVGKYAVITFGKNGLKEAYVGEGKSLVINNKTILPKGSKSAVYFRI